MFNLKIDAEDGSDEEAGGSDFEANGDLQLTKVSEMRIILSDPGQRILINISVTFK